MRFSNELVEQMGGIVSQGAGTGMGLPLDEQQPAARVSW